MMDLNMPFQHFVNYAGLTVCVLFVGLIGVCVMSLLFSLCLAITKQAQFAEDASGKDDAESNACIADYLLITRIF